MKVQLRITADGETFSLCTDTSTVQALPINQPDLPGWAKLTCQQCDECPLQESVNEWCPAAASIADIAASFLAKKRSTDPAVYELERDSLFFRVKTDLQTALSVALFYRMSLSGCPRLVFDWCFLNYFSPEFSVNKVLFQNLATGLVVEHLSKKLERPLARHPVNTEAFARVFSQMMLRLREESRIRTDAMNNALVHLHSSVVMTDQFLETIYDELAEEVGRVPLAAEESR